MDLLNVNKNNQVFNNLKISNQIKFGKITGDGSDLKNLNIKNGTIKGILPGNNVNISNNGLALMKLDESGEISLDNNLFNKNSSQILHYPSTLNGDISIKNITINDSIFKFFTKINDDIDLNFNHISNISCVELADLTNKGVVIENKNESDQLFNSFFDISNDEFMDLSNVNLENIQYPSNQFDAINKEYLNDNLIKLSKENNNINVSGLETIQIGTKQNLNQK